MAQTEVQSSTSTKPITSFSPETCAELVDKLTTDQLLREAQYVLDTEVLADLFSTRATRSGATSQPDSKQLSVELKSHFMSVSDSVHKLTLDIESLTTGISREIDQTAERIRQASSEMGKLQEHIGAAQQLLLEVTRTTPPLSQNVGATPTLSTGTSSTPTGTVPFEKLDVADKFASFKVSDLDKSCTYDRVYKNRRVAFYGEYPYRYPGGYHKARPITDNTYLRGIADELSKSYPMLEFNSAMVTKYDSPDSSIPPHSDDEECIVPDSSIVTLSLGSDRKVVFRRKLPGKYERQEFTVKHGEVYVMSRASQEEWDHSVPPVKRAEFPGTRLSITFRLLRKPTIAPPAGTPPKRNSDTSETTEAPIRKVLILSDSKNMTFDCSSLSEPTVAFRKNLFYLRDLEQHRQSIEQADLVLISAGINDLRHGKADPLTLHNHLAAFTGRFKTHFIFDSVSPVAMRADRFNGLNTDINRLNELMLEFSLRSQNFKLFDNLNFGLPHLARDGLHFNDIGKSSLSQCWVMCILIYLGLRRGSLPLRHSYRRKVDNFNLMRPG